MLERRAAGPTGRATAGAQDENRSYSLCLCSGSRQPGMKLVGQSPREPHRELGRLRVAVAALLEVRRPSSNTISVGGYNYYWSGHSDGHHLQGCSDPYCWRWYSDVCTAAKEINHKLVSTQRILQTCRVYRSAEVCGTDHRLVVVTLRVLFKTPQQANDHPWVFHLNRLKERECAQRVTEAISGCFTALDNVTDPVLLCDTFKRETLCAIQESIGNSPRAKQNFISQEALQATDACRAAHLTRDRDLHHSQVRRTQSLLRRDKEQFIRSLAEEVEDHFFVNFLRNLNSKSSLQVTAVHLVSGQITSDPVAVRERWDEYFEQLYQVDPPTFNFDEGRAVIPLPDPPISEDPSFLTEVREAISKLKSGKSAGICGIPAELLKAVGRPMARGIHAVLATIYCSP
ncbi:uncharacterized protein [Penaeus vannamei]|uniref:uncharacterized protein n=1 Tax=Penaeus vannamei TaxID=6689 RepID=UPI00387FB105